MPDFPLRPELGVLPMRLRRLPVDRRGYPVPWFVQWIDGQPEFRAMDPQKFAIAIREKRCWVCGDVLGAYLAFVIGPMCAVNRTSAEPPCHLECAQWSAEHCPFLSRPTMVRREDDLTAQAVPGDASLLRNPGCAGVWVTKSGYRFYRAPGQSASGYLIEMGPPLRVEWYAEGRPATRTEVEASIASGMPFLMEACDKETTALGRQDAKRALHDARKAADQWLPLAQ
jgi:hypothetical protein